MNKDKWAENYAEAVTAALDGKLVAITIGGTELECVIASVHETRVVGLSGHTELPHDGMIFIYQGDHTASFQRRGMAMEVSIWFFDKEGKLIASGWTDGEASASSPYRYVVETRPDVELEGNLKLHRLID